MTATGQEPRSSWPVELIFFAIRLWREIKLRHDIATGQGCWGILGRAPPAMPTFSEGHHPPALPLPKETSHECRHKSIPSDRISSFSRSLSVVGRPEKFWDNGISLNILWIFWLVVCRTTTNQKIQRIFKEHSLQATNRWQKVWRLGVRDWGLTVCGRVGCESIRFLRHCFTHQQLRGEEFAFSILTVPLRIWTARWSPPREHSLIRFNECEYLLVCLSICF